MYRIQQKLERRQFVVEKRLLEIGIVSLEDLKKGDDKSEARFDILRVNTEAGLKLELATSEERIRA